MRNPDRSYSKTGYSVPMQMMIKAVEECSDKEFTDLHMYGCTTITIADRLFDYGDALDTEIDKFFTHGGNLNLSVPPIVWKVLQRARKVRKYTF